MSTETETRMDLIQRCRELERRFVRLTVEGTNCSIGINWARQWAGAMLDTRGPITIYSNWIEQQEQRANRMESKGKRCDHDYAYTNGIGMGCVVYRCIKCGDEYEKDVS